MMTKTNTKEENRRGETGNGESRPWIVLKFGGTSVSTAARWRTIAETARERADDGLNVLLVCSALAGTSDELEELIATAQRSEPVGTIIDRLRDKHVALAEKLGLDGEELIGPHLEDLRQLATGAKMIGGAPARVRARIMSAGELMSTTLGAAWLRGQGVDTAWLDARELLTAERPPAGATENRRYLSSTCAYEPDASLRSELESAGVPVVITQGFVARDERGETVLLGRGGSDTSAAYFASRLQAQKLEIWTDVPGIFTANPRIVPDARLLRSVDYDEALMLASLGASILHPRCIAPARDAEIPIQIRCTPRPTLEGTLVTSDGGGDFAGVKAVTSRVGLASVTLGRDGKWQPVGFIADVAECFRKHGLSIDLISTSPSHIRATIDPAASSLDDRLLSDLRRDLELVASTEIETGLASVSLVGSGIRSVLHEVGETLESFEQADVRLLSQAANDSNFTFVVPVDSEEELVRDVHAAIFDERLPPEIFGPSWRRLMSRHDGPGGVAGAA